MAWQGLPRSSCLPPGLLATQIIIPNLVLLRFRLPLSLPGLCWDHLLSTSVLLGQTPYIQFLWYTLQK